jgi:hypothetical protein
VSAASHPSSAGQELRRADDPAPASASWASPMLRVWGGALAGSPTVGSTTPGVTSAGEPPGAALPETTQSANQTTTHPSNQAVSPPATQPDNRTTSAAVGIVSLPEGDGAVLILGRGEKADILLGDMHISRRHARLLMRRGRWFVEDLQSTWGTTLNGARVGAPAELRHGDLIVVGATALRYECYWDVLASPRAAPMRQAAESPPLPAAPLKPARQLAPPPPPLPASLPWEDNLKMIALALIVFACAGAIVLLFLADRAP